MAGSSVLVTGGGGFIGSHLAERLLRDGRHVKVLDNFATGRRENLAGIGGEIELVEGDVRSYERAHSAVRGCELVYHQAALPSVPRSVEDPLTSHESNVTGTLNVLLAAGDAGVRRVVFASSSSVYGPGEELPKHEAMPTVPIAPYAVAKLAADPTAARSSRYTGSRPSHFATSTSSGPARTRNQPMPRSSPGSSPRTRCSTSCADHREYGRGRARRAAPGRHPPLAGRDRAGARGARLRAGGRSARRTRQNRRRPSKRCRRACRFALTGWW